MVRPLIGITAGHQLPAVERGRRQEVMVGCSRNHVTAVVRAGGSAVLLPPLSERDAVRAVIDSVDGLLLTGGGDPSSLEFGEECHPSIQFVDPNRDRMELAAVQLAVRRGIPILGVCRGAQMLNVALGGGLVQDIAAEIERPVRHWNRDLAPSLTHTIEIETESLLASLTGNERMAVNSFHHQAVGRMGKGLKVTARTLDGVIEAIEADDNRPILGVQFHPEDVLDEHPQFLVFFSWLVREAKRRRRSRPGK